MNLVTIIENVEIERSNNKALCSAIENRLMNLVAQTDAELSTLEALVEQKKRMRADLDKALVAGRQEFDDRDAALAALIGGGE